MIVLCWNCRGLAILGHYKPDILFLMETKALSSRMEFFHNFLHFDDCFSVNRQGLGGGISLIWKSHVSVSVVDFSSNFIDLVVSEGNVQWRFTSYYGFPESQRRRQSSNLIRENIDICITCPFAKRVWLASSIGWLFPQSASFLAWLCSVLQLVRKEDQAMVVMICWALWQARNDVVWSSKWSSPAAVVYRARTILYDWCNARHVDDSSSNAVPAPPPLHFWVPPLQGFLKANVDAAVFPDGFIGVGGVLRSYDGSFVGACQHRLLGYFSPKTAELITIREVLSWIKRLGYDQIVLESDALTVVKALLSSSTSDFSSFGSLVDDCKSLIAEMNSVSVSFVPRSANSVAHLIARAASTISDRIEWLSTPPQLIVHALMLDFQI
ncbi:hypothetical protein MANES_07G069794v8 [Manihot esculenta]|uniref:Uncharacterized protein n=1 Tax=Manihot esculenta TaxID=3983 RepID=A0ACB7HIW3_MANES|nr:hypothetical protein MANES_07G069794v8 [Manihot esculenta]